MEQYTDDEKAELRDFMERLENGEVPESEIKDIESKLSKSDKRSIRRYASTNAKNRRSAASTIVKGQKARARRKADRDCKKRCRKSK